MSHFLYDLGHRSVELRQSLRRAGFEVQARLLHDRLVVEHEADLVLGCRVAQDGPIVLEAYGNDVMLQPGETLFFQGDTADGMYWIESGVVVVLQGDLA